jgi:hypothetical protein
MKSVSLLRLMALIVIASASTQGQPALYPSMAPLEQYLMADRNAEIALARSAAPAAISSDADVLVLTRHGYETAVKGKNGFVCVVERSWTAAFHNAEFWNPKIRAPICFNPTAARSVLPLTVKRTELVLAGASKPKMFDSIKAVLDSKEVPLPEPGAMAYMMSKQQCLSNDLGDYFGPWVPI